MSNKPKFNVGNTAWCCLHSEIVPVIVKGVRTHEDRETKEIRTIYSVATILPYFGKDDLYYTTIFESELSRTPDELIEKVKSLDFTGKLQYVMRKVQELEKSYKKSR